MPRLNTRLNADIALLFAAAVWGLAFVFQKSAMDHIGPLAFIAARGAIAALALAPLALREHRRATSSGIQRILDDRRLGRRCILCRRLAAAGWHQNRHRHQYRLPHCALCGHYAVHRLGLERQSSQPDRVAGGGPVGHRHLAARRRHACRVLAGRPAGGAVGAVLGDACGRHGPGFHLRQTDCLHRCAVCRGEFAGRGRLHDCSRPPRSKGYAVLPSTSPTWGCCRAPSPSRS